MNQSLLTVHTCVYFNLQQFSRGHFDITKSPVPIDGRVLHTLRLQLHSIKKCFSGKEFVDKVMETGRECDLLESVSDTDSPESLKRSSVSLGSSHVFSPTGQPIEYTPRYACELGQFLLKERVLILLPKSATIQELTPQQSLVTERRRHQLTASFEHHDGFNSSHSHDYSPGTLRNTLSSRGTGASSAESLGHGRAAPYRYNYHPHSNVGQVRDPGPEFMNNANTFYKFADSEDKEQSVQYQNQILVASSHIPPHPPSTAAGQRTGTLTGAETCSEHAELSNARQETLFLVFDLLVQRARREKRVKQFLVTPRALETQGLRRANPHTNCNFILKM